MPLPENRADRIKVYALLALGIGGAFYALWAFVYQPLNRERWAVLEHIETIEHNLQTARITIRRMDELQAALAESARNLRARAEYDLIHPRLGNYLLQARETVIRHGLDAGIETIRVTELDFANPPRRPDNEPPRRTRAYAVRVTAECRYADLLVWLQLLEEENPLLAISQLQVLAQENNRLQHQVRFELQWPVWIDPATRDTVNALVAEVLTEEEGL